MNKKGDRFYSSVLNKIKRDFTYSSTNEELVRLRKVAENDIRCFLQSGETSFFRKALIFGEEQMIEIMLEQSLADLGCFHIEKSTSEFASNPSLETYGLLCRAYFWDILTYLQTCKDFNNSPTLYLESDVCLIYLFALTYCNDFIDIIEPYIIKGLRNIHDKRINNIRPVTSDYGDSSLIPLADFLSKQYNRPAGIRDSLNLFLRNTVPCYSYAFENILTSDELVLNKCTNDLVEFHIEKSKTSDLTYPFHKEHWIFFPIEIISLLVLRSRKGLSNNNIVNPCYLDNFTPYINESLEIKGLSLDLFHKILK